MNTPDSLFDDVALASPGKNLELALSDVGLENVQTQVRFEGMLLPALANAGVSLIDKKARGIHMSRIFQILNQLHTQDISWSWLSECVRQMLLSQKSLSDRGYIQVQLALPVLRKALVTSEQGWRNYPLTFRVTSVDDQLQWHLKLQVLYSSTCPCSASLSRQTVQEQFLSQFQQTQIDKSKIVEWLGKTESIVATPHAQRSEAIVEFKLNPEGAAPLPLSLIDEMEKALGTPVQSAVKREDEREFARRNAKNLMFCEDAARKLKSALLKRSDIEDFSIEVRHFESLHPHDVVARASKSF